MKDCIFLDLSYVSLWRIFQSMTTPIFHTLWTLTQAFEKQQHSFSWTEAESTVAIFITFQTHTGSLLSKSHFLWLAEKLHVRSAVCFLALSSRTKAPEGLKILLPSGWAAGWYPESAGKIMILLSYDVTMNVSTITFCFSQTLIHTSLLRLGKPQHFCC